MIKLPSLFQEGFHLSHFSLSDDVKTFVLEEDWNKVDSAFKKLTARDGELFKFLKQFHDFSEIEFIISIRDANNDWEEDGIWHDDGSRVFAFSLSLTMNPTEILGGKLGMRKKGEIEFKEISTPPFGSIILFLTGIYGYEHKIHQVTRGRRIIIAGWCS